MADEMMEVSPPSWLKTLELYCKIVHKMHRSQNDAKKNRAIGGYHGRVNHHGPPVAATTGSPWWWLSDRLLLFFLILYIFFFVPSFVALCCIVFTGGIWHILTVLVFLGLLASFVDPLGLKNIF